MRWDVLLIGGHSTSGKSTVAKRIGTRLGIPVSQVDDHRIGLQRVTHPGQIDGIFHTAEIEVKNIVLIVPVEGIRVMPAVGPAGSQNLYREPFRSQQFSQMSAYGSTPSGNYDCFHYIFVYSIS